ncbi:MAG: class I SAM-dependent methyltransferase [bacterium]|nr:class I SAM-dependent methyltransferase [bacterium]
MASRKDGVVFKFVNYSLKALLQVFFAAWFWRDRKLKENVQRTITLYKKDGFASLFTRIRFWDAPFEELEELTPKEGVIIDLGCGDGILTNYLALGGPKRKLVGIELNRERLEVADKGLPNTEFILGDVTKRSIPNADAILTVHLLHHLPSYAAQEELIQLCSKKLKDGGSLIVAEVDRKPFLKYLFSWVTDAIIVPMLFEKKFFSTKFFYRSADEWKELFTRNGFRVKTTEAHKGKPFSHIIFECEI